jgi:hypothetical protein
MMTDKKKTRERRGEVEWKRARQGGKGKKVFGSQYELSYNSTTLPHLFKLFRSYTNTHKHTTEPPFPSSP